MDEKTKRNQKIVDEKAQGATFRELSLKYDLSIGRIQEILKNDKLKRLLKK